MFVMYQCVVDGSGQSSVFDYICVTFNSTVGQHKRDSPIEHDYIVSGDEAVRGKFNF